MEENNIIKCIIKPKRIFYPKNTSVIQTGEFGIFVAEVVKPLENCNLHTIKLKGNVCKLKLYNEYKVTCELTEHNEKYGDTYNIIFINEHIDMTNLPSQRKFLLSILNENTVNNLYDMYGDKTISLFENEDIKALCKVKGIKNKTAMKLIERYNDSKDYSEIYTKLNEYNLSKEAIEKLVGKYKSVDKVIDVIKNNPYDLVNVSGFGFSKADEIAQKNPNITLDKRLKGFILYTLKTKGEQGKSYLLYTELLNEINDKIGYVQQDVFNKVAKELMDKKEVVVTENGNQIGLRYYYDLEKQIANELLRILNANESIIDIKDAENKIKQLEEEQGFEFTEEQKQAILMFAKHNIVALTGGSGTGKTTTTKGMLELAKKYNIGCCALSGKASLRIKEATGFEASTIHKLLDWNEGKFTFNSEEQLPNDGVLLDEGTMVNGNIFLSLLKAIPSGAKLIIAGDVQQLTPIGNCQVFADILMSGVIPSIKLTKPHRQALESGIIPLSLDIINQKQIFKSNFYGTQILGKLKDMELNIFKEESELCDVAISQFMKWYNELQDLNEVQLITCMKTRGECSVFNLNTKIQQLINPINPKRKCIKSKIDKDHIYTIQTGDKVINTKNKYKCVDEFGTKTPVFNGNIGIVKEIYDDGSALIDFVGIGRILFAHKDCASLELAYACTVHKLQGSESKVAITVIGSSQYILLNAELLYTAITRAKKYSILVGENKAVRMAISRREVKTKQTYLKDILLEESKNNLIK